MALTLLRYISEDRIKDVIYFNPDDIDPLAMNLEIPEGLKDSALEREKDRIAESVILCFRKIFSDDDSEVATVLNITNNRRY